MRCVQRHGLSPPHPLQNIPLSEGNLSYPSVLPTRPSSPSSFSCSRGTACVTGPTLSPQHLWLQCGVLGPPGLPPLLHLCPWASWSSPGPGPLLAAQPNLWPGFCHNDLVPLFHPVSSPRQPTAQGSALSTSLVTATNWFPSQPIHTSSQRQGVKGSLRASHRLDTWCLSGSSCPRA